MNPQEHPITPTHEQVALWGWQAPEARDAGVTRERYIATKAARWGADQELEACCLLAETNPVCGTKHQRRTLVAMIKERRRPKPPSLKEQALAELDLLKADATTHGLGFDAPAIRRALESLPE